MTTFKKVLLAVAAVSGIAGSLVTAPAVSAAEVGGYCIGMIQADGSTRWYCDGGLGACKSASECP